MATPAQIRRWLSSTSRDWYGACAGLAYNIIAHNGGQTYRSYGSATEAYEDTVIESMDPAAAPPGAQHYWSYYGRDWRRIYGNWGHVATDIYGGGHSILSATRLAREFWGVHAGIISVTAQTVAGMKYLGWSRTYGRRNRITIELPSPSGGGSTPVTPTDPRLDQIMSTLPIVLKIVNFDNAGNPTSAGLSGVHVLLDHDHGYVYPANEYQALQTVSAPYFNNGVATPGSKLSTQDPSSGRAVAARNGETVLISEQNLVILLDNLDFPNPATLVQQVATQGGGHFYRP